MPEVNESNTGFEIEDPKKADAPKAYMNLAIVDNNGVEHRIRAGIAIGGKHEKGISASVLSKLGDESYEFKLVGRLNSAETKVVEMAL